MEGSVWWDHVGRASALHRTEVNNIFLCVCVWDVFLWRIVTNLVRKHIAGDFVGNDVRIIREDVVQNWAVIFSWNEMRRRRKEKKWSWQRRRVANNLLRQPEGSPPGDEEEDGVCI